MSLPLFDLALPTPEEVKAECAEAFKSVSENAELAQPGFAERAASFILDYLHVYGATAGEVLTLAAKNYGIKPHDDRAFGPVYWKLAKAGQIHKVGSVKRARGHGTSGGSVWAVRR